MECVFLFCSLAQLNVFITSCTSQRSSAGILWEICRLTCTWGTRKTSQHGMVWKLKWNICSSMHGSFQIFHRRSMLCWQRSHIFMVSMLFRIRHHVSMILSTDLESIKYCVKRTVVIETLSLKSIFFCCNTPK